MVLRAPPWHIIMISQIYCIKVYTSMAYYNNKSNLLCQSIHLHDILLHFLSTSSLLLRWQWSHILFWIDYGWFKHIGTKGNFVSEWTDCRFHLWQNNEFSFCKNLLSLLEVTRILLCPPQGSKHETCYNLLPIAAKKWITRARLVHENQKNNFEIKEYSIYRRPLCL